MYNWNDISALLYNFENECPQEISKIKSKGFLSWQIVKAPLYYFVIKNASGYIPSEAGGNVQLGKIKWLSLPGRFFKVLFLTYRLAKLFIRSLLKPNPVLLVANTGDRFSKYKNGKYFNHLIDPFIEQDCLVNYIYAETGRTSVGKNEVFQPVDFNLEDFSAIRFLFSFYYSGKENIKKESGDLHLIFSNFLLNKKMHLKIDREVFYETLLNFYVDASIYRIFLGIAKPGKILASEKLGTGLIAAARKKNIPLTDLQHGLIDKHNPQYQYCRTFSGFKQSMLLPEKIAIFGAFHAGILLEEGFWSKEELTILGSYRIEVKRSDDYRCWNNRVLIPTQWTVFEETKALLEDLIDCKDKSYVLVLKMHPHEKLEHIKFYKNFQAKNKHWVTISDADIFALLKETTLVLGFDSTAILEAVALGKPSVTLGVKSMPNGIHDLIDSSLLKDAIKILQCNQISEIHSLLNTSIADEVWYNEWVKVTKREGDSLYDANYFRNIKGIV